MKRLDDVLGYGLKIFQDSDFFSFSLDSIVLANYCIIRKKDKMIVDFCTGNGIVPLILSERINKHIIGVEIQKKLVNLAQESVIFNNLDNQIDIIHMDIKAFSKNNLNNFDVVLCNPPFFKVEAKSLFNSSCEKTIARHEIFISLDDICACAKRVLKDNGNFFMVHRCTRLNEVLDTLKKHGLEPKRLKFIHDNIEKSASLFLVESQKCGKVGLIIDKPLILHNIDGSISKEYYLLQKEIKS